MKITKSKLREIIREELLNESKNPLQTKIERWIDTHQKKYEKFVESLFIGKSINAMASAYKDRGGDWKMHEINNIKNIRVDGGEFFSEVSVQDENGDWYTILRDGPLTVKK